MAILVVLIGVMVISLWFVLGGKNDPVWELARQNYRSAPLFYKYVYIPFMSLGLLLLLYMTFKGGR